MNCIVDLSTGNTSLHVAAEMGHLPCMKKLLNMGADINKSNSFGVIPLALALQHSNSSCVRLLLIQGGIHGDMSFIWRSKYQLEGPYSWMNYSKELMKILLLATPHLGAEPSDVLTQFYRLYFLPAEHSEIIKLYLLTGNHVTKEQCQILCASGDEEMARWIKQARSVQNLQYYCTVAVRRTLSPNVYYGANNLCIPERLKSYLLLDFDNYT